MTIAKEILTDLNFGERVPRKDRGLWVLEYQRSGMPWTPTANVFARREDGMSLVVERNDNTLRVRYRLRCYVSSAGATFARRAL